MSLDVRSPKLLDLIDADAQLEQLGTGCEFHRGTYLECGGQVSVVQRHPCQSDEKVDAGIRHHKLPCPFG